MKPIIGLIYLFYFIFYSISPIVFTVCPKQAAESGYTSESAQVLICDAIARTMIRKGKGTRDHEGESVLIRKKRALIPETYSAKLFCAGHTAGLQEVSYPMPEWAFCNRPGIVLTGIYKGFQSMLAGHSPPSA